MGTAFDDLVQLFFSSTSFLTNNINRTPCLAALFTFFALLAIFAASLGLLGLASYVLQRTKEIGIRKSAGRNHGWFGDPFIKRLFETGISRLFGRFHWPISLWKNGWPILPTILLSAGGYLCWRVWWQ
ncbi:MAG: hypothetical protein R2788_02400 [Saprospiraceae bacterium]